jgi:uncharacterized protein (TIGR00251 family)
VSGPPSEFLELAEAGIRLRVKAVPGASRDAIAGVLGDRLKIRVAAPPEGGRANEAILRLLANAFDVAKADVGLVAGATSRDKTFEIAGDPVHLASRVASLI